MSVGFQHRTDADRFLESLRKRRGKFGLALQEVLSRLYAEAEVSDSQLLTEEQAIAATAGGVIDDQALATIRERSFMAVAPEVGQADLSARARSSSQVRR